MKLSIDYEVLRIEMQGFEKLLGFKSRLVIPLEHITSANTDDLGTAIFRGIRGPGTNIPGILRAGTYHTKQGKEFWYAPRGRKYLTIELKDESYKRIVLGIHENQYWAEMINSAVKRYSKHRKTRQA